MSMKDRIPVTTPELLKAWRLRYGLEQKQIAPLFFRSRRAYQNIEGGKLKVFPHHIDLMCRLYEAKHKPKQIIKPKRKSENE